jgi:hypothetical protein
MATNTGNIIVGAAALAVGTVAGTIPTTFYTDGIYNTTKNAVSATAAGRDWRTWVQNLTSTGTTVTLTGGATVNWRDVGLTQEGVEVTYSPEYGEVEVDQVLDAAKLFKQKMSVMVKTTFAEPTLRNLLFVWDLADSNLTAPNYDSVTGQSAIQMNPGTLGESPAERALLFVGPRPGGTSGASNQRVYLAGRAISVESSSTGIKRSEATVFPVTFRLLPDLGASVQQYGRIIDVA